eukprot:sb/3462541/
MKRGGIAITTYGIIEKNFEFLMNSNFKWDYLVLDEGHKIKNPTKTSKAVRQVPCRNRLLISGTPIQNNLKELWALFDFVSRGQLLGTMTTFKSNYIVPIERGREKDASRAEAKLGAKLAESLRKVIHSYFLRRTKAEIKASKVDTSSGVKKLGKKNELCVWLKLSPAQHSLYSAFLTLDSVRDAMNQTKSPLAALTVLKKICDHPRLAIKFEALREVMDADNMDMKGQLLGTMTTFKSNYIVPIERGREKDASRAEAKLGAKLAESLRKVIHSYFLRRTKAEIKASKVDTSSGVKKLGKKNELCVWLKLSPAQHSLYSAFLTLDSVRDAMNQTKSPLAALTVLKKICDHPRLAIKFEALREVMDADNMDMNQQEHKKILDSLRLPADPSDDLLLTEGCKLNFAVRLLELLHNDGHRTLFFSTSLKILNYLERMIGDRGLRCLRIDGSISKPADRQTIIDTFNKNHKFSVLLLTTQVGGVGLNLTSANRVVIYDPNWNPATDSQAVDRAYRIGQTKHVTVYRLLTCGTIEEKIYRKQVFKDGITRQATGDSFDPIRYFTNQERSQLFEFASTDYSETCNQMEELHGAERNYSEEMKMDLERVIEMKGVIGCSDHDLLFSHEEDTVSTPQEQQFVQERCQVHRNTVSDGVIIIICRQIRICGRRRLDGIPNSSLFREHHRSNNLEKARNYYKAALQIRNDDITVQKAYLGLKKQLK